MTAGEGRRFTPRFLAAAGTDYAVVGRADARDGSWRELARIRVPGAPPAPSTVVESIEPGIASVPANLLRFAITFSAPMEEGSAAGRIRLLDECGRTMPGTMLPMPPELWDAAGRRLTVLIEPGRIKRGLQPHVQAGAPLREGGRVTLVVDAAIRDAAGAPLAGGAQRTYDVGPPIRSRVDPERWSFQRPETEAAPLVVRFDRPLDRALVRRCIQVQDTSGLQVRGRAELDAEALVWTFTPAEAWSDWRLRVDARLEDVAGNSVRRVFDRDLQRSDDDGIDVVEVMLV